MKTATVEGSVQDPNIEDNSWSCGNYQNDMSNDGPAINRDVYSKGR